MESVTNARRGSTRTSAFARIDTPAQQKKHRSSRVRGASLRQDHVEEGGAEDPPLAYTMMHAATEDKQYKSPVSVWLYVCVAVCVYVLYLCVV